jgi:hypothetical protein
MPDAGETALFPPAGDAHKRSMIMGLYVHTLADLSTVEDASRKYFLYVLDYGWKEPLAEALIEHFGQMSRMALESKNSVVLIGYDPRPLLSKTGFLRLE